MLSQPYEVLIVASFARLARETDIVGYPVLPLIRQLAEQTPTETARYIHWGATTQVSIARARPTEDADGVSTGHNGQCNDNPDTIGNPDNPTRGADLGPMSNQPRSEAQRHVRWVSDR